MDGRTFVIWSLWITIATGWHQEQNTVFKKTSEAIITRSKWIITFVVDLKPYEALLDSLEGEVTKLGMARARVAANYLHNDGYRDLLFSLNMESRVMEFQWKDMKNYLRGIKMLQTRQKRSVLPIVGKALSVLFGTVSEGDMKVIRRKLRDIEKNQKSLAHVARESVSIINVTRLETMKNREMVNQLVNYLHKWRGEMDNVTDELRGDLQELNVFSQQFFQLMLIANRVKQTSQTLSKLLEHVRSQLDMLSLGHLSPSIVTPGHLRELLLKVQSELPHHLRLPVDPTEHLWQYYNSLGCVTLLEGDKLLILVSVPLLDRDSTFEIFRIYNLPIPFPQGGRGLNVIAKYKIETDFIAFNLERTKFMLLSREEADTCEKNSLSTCSSSSPIYVSANHRLCVLGLFRGNKHLIDNQCQVEVYTDAILPKAISIADGVWVVSTQETLSLSKVCEGVPTESIDIPPPLKIIKLPLGCSAYGPSIALPPYYQAEEKFEKQDELLQMMTSNMGIWTELWSPLIFRFKNKTLNKLPQVLKPVEKIDLQSLTKRLELIEEVANPWSDNENIIVLYSLVTTLFVAGIAIVLGVYVRSLGKRKKMYIKARVSGKSELETPFGIIHTGMTDPDEPDHELQVVDQNDIEKQELPRKPLFSAYKK